MPAPAELAPAPAEPAPPPAEIRVEPLPVLPLFVPLQRPERSAIPELIPYIPPSVPAPPPEAPASPEPVPPEPVPPAAETPPAPRVEIPPAEAPPVAVPITQPVVSAPVPTPPVERAPVEVPPVPVPPLERVTPPKFEAVTNQPEGAAIREQRRAPQMPPPVENAQPRTPAREAPAAAEPAPHAPSAAPSGPVFDFLNAPRGAPREAPDARKPPGLDLDAVRNRARELARQGTGQRALLPFPMPVAPPRKSKEEIALENARKPDCQTAYKDLGLLAVIPLLANEIGEGSCRWR